jgi:diguanylate cyclase
VLECVADLDTLQASQALELRRCRQLELEIIAVRSELARAQAELLGTRADERRARYLALHDSLTGLPNRRYFGEQLEQSLAPTAALCCGLAVLYLDLDGLKSINDLHGHDTGDHLLRIVATRLHGAVRAQDMVSRLGGDEFACLLKTPLSRDELSRVACKLFDTVSAPMQIGRRRLSVRPSIGIATYPAAGATGEALLKQADRAMYRAKRDQLGYAFYDPATDDRMADVNARPSAPPARRRLWRSILHRLASATPLKRAPAPP